MSKKNTDEINENLNESPKVDFSEKVQDEIHKAEKKIKKVIDKTEEKPKKSEKHLEELENLKQELATANDQLLRLGAEFDNFKKRTERERMNVASFAKASTLKNLIPALDNAELALNADHSSEDYVKGVELLVKQLKETLLSEGLEEINPENESFDPNLHNAVMHIDDETLGENVVIEVFQKGYKLGENVLRPAMVKVAN